MDQEECDADLVSILSPLAICVLLEQWELLLYPTITRHLANQILTSDKFVKVYISAQLIVNLVSVQQMNMWFKFVRIQRSHQITCAQSHASCVEIVKCSLFSSNRSWSWEYRSDDLLFRGMCIVQTNLRIRSTLSCAGLQNIIYQAKCMRLLYDWAWHQNGTLLQFRLGVVYSNNHWRFQDRIGNR